jgi:hypothetical protein
MAKTFCIRFRPLLFSLITCLTLGVFKSATAQDQSRVTNFSPSELGVFPTDEHKPYYQVHGATDVRFRSWLVDDDFPGGAIAQTVICDFTGDGKPEYHIGSSAGKFIYKPEENGSWTRFQIRDERGPTDAGAVALDLNGNERCDLVAGEAWYKNPGFENGQFLADELEEHIFAEVTGGIHDQILADINGDGRKDMVTLNDNMNPIGVHWNEIPENPEDEWVRHSIGYATHQGIAPNGAGDLNGNGYIDLVRADIWWENVNGDGSWWRPHSLGAIHSLPPSRLDDAGFANETQTYLADINGNGRLDIVHVDGEARGEPG